MSHVSGGLVYKRYLNALRGPSIGGEDICTDGPVWALVTNGAAVNTSAMISSTLYDSDADEFLVFGTSGANLQTRFSADKGQTWQSRPDLLTGGFGTVSRPVAGNGLILVRINAIDVARTSDRGATWAVSAGPVFNSSRGTFVNGDFYFVTSTVVRVTPDGVSWTSRTITGLGVFSPQSNVASNGTGRLVIACTSGVNGRMAVSEDGGATWALGAIPSPWAGNAPSTLYFENGLWVGIRAGGINEVYYSLDGLTWVAGTLAGPGIWAALLSQGRWVGVSRLVTNVAISNGGQVWTQSANLLPLAVGATSIATDGEGNYVARPLENNSRYFVGSC